MTWTRWRSRQWRDRRERSKQACDRIITRIFGYNPAIGVVLVNIIIISLKQVIMDASPECRVCLAHTTSGNRVQLKCQHVFCAECVKKYIEVLRNYRLLTPEKLRCLEAQCQQEMQDAVISKLFPGEVGYIYNLIKKRYRQSKDPNNIIFDCEGYITMDRKPVLPKPAELSKQSYWKTINQKVRKLATKEETNQNTKTCKNILSLNRNVPRKQNYIQCNVCSCAYCISCFKLAHEGACQEKKPEDLAIINSNNKNTQDKVDEIDNFVQRNGILRCLNPKCRVAIAKQEGCFWIKCRCSWQMCYPCSKLWGDCEHFKDYPYKKFVPPPEWMVKALNLY